MDAPITLFWFRQDLRLSDNPGFWEAAKMGPVMPVYILDDAVAGSFKMGGPSRWWLYHSLNSLNHSLKNKLNVYEGNSQDVLLKLIEDNKLKAVYWNRCYEPWRIREDTDIKSLLKSMGIDCRSFNGSLLWEPHEILKKDKKPYQVYTPFYRHGCLQAPKPRFPLPKPEKMSLVEDAKNPHTIEALGLLPPKNWYTKMEPYWNMGEEAAQKKLTAFLDIGLQGYKENRDYPSKPNISKLSPHLHFGEISPNQVWYAAQTHGMDRCWFTDVDCFLSELGWREFSTYLLYHFPELPTRNFQSKFDAFPWKEDDRLFKKWRKGQTGYPLVDAGMRELWETGFMHNRVRMIVASFLVKNLGLHWHHGEKWFWDCLVDADLANNSASWQWVAGSGVDAAPYFRIFNPTTQGEKFDKEGAYTRRYVPELRSLPNQFLFKPWEAPSSILEGAKIVLDKTYPRPIVDLRHSRDQALQAYAALKNLNPSTI